MGAGLAFCLLGTPSLDKQNARPDPKVLLIQKGKYYYLGNKGLLPEYVSKKIKSFEQNKNGLKVTFYK
ncbi:hypothetical protein ACEK07_35325 [Alcanivoracaceae bacterium MT1]